MIIPMKVRVALSLDFLQSPHHLVEVKQVLFPWEKFSSYVQVDLVELPLYARKCNRF